ncbi:MAG TPA: hypothetical protein VGF33_08020, partial [Caulobacteraceae bacterium]
MRVVILASAAVFLLASTADAQNADAVALEAVAPATHRPLDLSLRQEGVYRAVPQPSAIEAPASAKTSIDHQFTPDGLVGAAGYLCGIGGIGPDSDALR